MTRVAIFLVLAASVASGCGGDDGSSGGSDAGDAVCRSGAECDDGLFCNGVERCEPSDPASSDRGCVVGASPCSAAQRCDDAMDECVTECAMTPDADGDGRDAMECGGDDCDDSDAMRFPGNTEVCDAAGHDEDCDATTFGDRDADGDGFVDAACCDASSGTAVCGDDCDDSEAAVHPTEAEVCNGIDDDCDGTVDEGLLATFYPDADEDGAGDPSMPLMACRRPVGYVDTPDDCDDSDATVHPDATDTCDGVDSDCDGTTDEDENCGSRFPGAIAACVSGACELVSCMAGRGDCDLDDRTGCETVTDTEISHCGTCGNMCPINRADACMGGACLCSASGRSCTGTEFCCGSLGCVDLAADINNCGGCGATCGPSATHCAAMTCRCGDGPECPTGQTCTSATPTSPRQCT